MTRSTAREIAIQLGFAAASSGEAPQELFDSFERGHYDTLAAEDELYSEYPNTKQLEYIRTLIALTGEHRDEIDAHITRYAKGWKLSASPARRLQCCAALSARYCIWTISRTRRR